MVDRTQSNADNLEPLSLALRSDPTTTTTCIPSFLSKHAQCPPSWKWPAKLLSFSAHLLVPYKRSHQGQRLGRSSSWRVLPSLVSCTGQPRGPAHGGLGLGTSTQCSSQTQKLPASAPESLCFSPTCPQEGSDGAGGGFSGVRGQGLPGPMVVQARLPSATGLHVAPTASTGPPALSPSPRPCHSALLGLETWEGWGEVGKAGCQGNCILLDLGVSCHWGPSARASLLEDTSPLGFGMGSYFPSFCDS